MRRRPRSQLLVLGAFLLAGVTALPALAVRAAADQSTRPFPGGEYFVVGCGFSHMDNDDPIVFPGKPGASHNHTFIGNRVVDSATTPASLLGGDSTCLDVGDASAYWVPTLFAGGRAVKPLVGAGYYVRRTLGPVQPFPPGLKMIAGNQNARRAQSLSVVGWACGGLGTYPDRQRCRPAGRIAPSICARPSRTAGTGATSTASITSATWPTRSPECARARTRWRCRAWC